ncbi:TapY2 family type IVa secretion system protein [Aeromonas rivuli]|jgi:hypothetical protein|uniref:TapY2 family type IVa secretion system protein n=1 Tax=Aeromonas rivuli TaxID=648794 RepID=UPI001CCDFD93|nr:TapY2 family type IVa secretion system protein [Aeromonas rivuli]UBO73527.1 TapY2 family type IVa secretion system protein [Aeromonas rivuli]
MRLLSWMVALGLSMPVGAQAADMKCYVELASGQRVVLQGTMGDASPMAIQEKFKGKGYEVNGVIQPVNKVLECLPLGEVFQSKEAKLQDANQLR